MSNFTTYVSHLGTATDKFFKSTLFHSQRLLLGLNSLEPGQTQKVHTHRGQDKFYFVLEGEGSSWWAKRHGAATPGTPSGLRRTCRMA